MKKITYLPLIILVLTIVIFFKPYLFQGKLPIPADTIIGLYHPFRDLYANTNPNGIAYKNFLTTDPVRQQYPWRQLSIDTLKQTNLPLWNPYEMAGTPLLGNFQSAAFYPLNIVLLILPFAQGWSLLVLLQPILAGVFLSLYLRFMRLSTPAAWLGSITFAFCGFATAWMEWNTLFHVALWLPLILLAKEHLLKRISIKWFVILIFAQVAAFFAGHLQTFLYIVLIHDTYLIARIIQIAIKEKKKHIFPYAFKKYLPFILHGGIVLLITAVQWIPTLQFINLSARGVDQINGWQQSGWFVPWQHLIQFIAPDFFGNPTTLNYWGEWNYGEFVGYVGIVPLIMALYALVFRHDKKTIFFGVLFLLSLVFALPTFLAKIPYLLEVPFLSTTQPTRLLLITDFSLAILAALGLDFFLKVANKIRILYIIGIVGVLFGALWVYVISGSTSVTAENMVVAKRNLYIPTFFFIIATILLLVLIFNSKIKSLDKMLNRKLLNTLLLIFLLSISVFDLFRFFDKFTPFTDKNYLFPSTKAITFLQKQEGQFRIMSTDSMILPPNFTVAYRLQTLDGYDPLYLLRYGELIAAVKRDKPDNAAPFGFNRIITPQKTDSRLIDLLGVQYVLSFSDLPKTKFEKVFTEGKTKVFKNKDVSPRAFLVNNIVLANNKDEALRALFDNKNDLHKTAIVESIPADLAEKRLTSGSAEIVSYKDNEVIVKTSTSAESFLVLMDSFYPTWKAKVCTVQNENCTDLLIVLTNYNFRGIFIPGGNHHIVFYNSLL
jgi:hypothetical protein